MKAGFLSTKAIQYGAIALLIVGITFRFYALDRKVYWIDETYTSLRISGYSEAELVQILSTSPPVTAAELQQYQQPNAQKDLTDTLRSLTDSPQHPPLYFLLGRLWEQAIGHSKASLRTLSALLSLGVFPALFWLGRELRWAGVTLSLAIAIVSVSPLQVLYAQEARQYSLWIALTLASSAALLRALRLSTTTQDLDAESHSFDRSSRAGKLAWGIYAVSLALSFYTFLLTGLVAIAHGVYVGIQVLLQRNQAGLRILKAYWLSVLGAIVAFSPWLGVMITHLDRVTGTASWTEQRFPLDWLVLRWLLYPINGFFDLNLGDRYLTSPAIGIMLAITLLIGSAIRGLRRDAPHPEKWLILCLIGVPALALILPDLIWGGQRSATARYMIPVYLGIQLAVAFYLSHQSFQAEASHRGRWQLGMIALVLCGLLSCGVSAQADLWWNKSPDKHQYNSQMVEILNQSERSLLISDDSTELSDCFVCRILSLSYDLNPTVSLQLVVNQTPSPIPPDYPDIFVLSPSRPLMRRFERMGYDANLVFEADRVWFWQLMRRADGREK